MGRDTCLASSNIPNIVEFIIECDRRIDGDQHMTPMRACHAKTLEPVIAAAVFYNGNKETAEKL